MSEHFFERQPSTAEIMRRVEGFQSWVEVDLDAIGFNLEQVKARTRREIIPCIKASAYGHGLTPVAAYLMKKGVKRVLIAKLSEAEQIRDADLNCGVVSLDPLFSDEQFETVVKREITQTVYSLDTSEHISSTAKRLGKTANLWVKVDTGLGRVGVRWSEAADLIEQISQLPYIRIDGVFSTMSEADELDKIQVQRMEKVRDQLKSRNVNFGTISMASSNAVFHKPYTFLDAVRPGLMLFGFYPDPEDRDTGIKLLQAFAFKARIEQVKTVEEGDSLTYSRRFTADHRMQVGTVHIGYSDGYPRGLTTKGLINVKGIIKPVLGTVSVNHFLVDLTDTDAKVGDAVEAISREGENNAHKVADAAGIMTYSLMVGLNPLTPRVYTEKGIPIAIYEPRLIAS
jgi:alanine racemase